MRLITIFLVLLTLTAVAFAAEKPKEAPPTFKPGADVALELTVRAPEGWNINYLLPVQVIFDEEYLRKAPFSVNNTSFSFKLKEYADEAVFTVPVKLNAKASAGDLKIPFKLDYSICNVESDECTFDTVDFNVGLKVESSAPAGEKNRALSSGTLKSVLNLRPAMP